MENIPEDAKRDLLEKEAVEIDFEIVCDKYDKLPEHKKGLFWLRSLDNEVFADLVIDSMEAEENVNDYICAAYGYDIVYENKHLL